MTEGIKHPDDHIVYLLSYYLFGSLFVWVLDDLFTLMVFIKTIRIIVILSLFLSLKS